MKEEQAKQKKQAKETAEKEEIEKAQERRAAVVERKVEVKRLRAREAARLQRERELEEGRTMWVVGMTVTSLLSLVPFIPSSMHLCISTCLSVSEAHFTSCCTVVANRNSPVTFSSPLLRSPPFLTPFSSFFPSMSTGLPKMRFLQHAAMMNGKLRL